jgi:hypothetical protein
MEMDALPLYRKYVDLFEIDSVPEDDHKAVARQVAEQVLVKVAANDGPVSGAGLLEDGAPVAGS